MKLSHRFLLYQQRRALAAATTFVRRRVHTHIPTNTPPPQYQIRDPTLGMRSITSFSFIHARRFSIQHQPQQHTQEEENGGVHGERKLCEVHDMKQQTPNPPPPPPPTPASNIPAGSKTRVWELISPFPDRQKLVKVCADVYVCVLCMYVCVQLCCYVLYLWDDKE